MANYRRVARRKARKYGLNPRVFVRQIQQESGFNPRAVSPAGARGIAQIMPATAQGWGVDPMRPRQALDAAARHMAEYVRQFGSYENALRAYNAGPGAVEKSRNYAETNNYVRAILGGLNPDPPGEPARRRRGGSRTVTETVPGVDNSQLRKQLLLSYLAERGRPGALASLAIDLREAKDVPARTVTRTVRAPARSSGGATRRPRGVRRAAGKPSDLRELFYNGPGGVNVDEGRRVGRGFVSGHTDHVHVAGATRAQTVALANLARKMGLTVRELEPFDKVDPVHTKGSFHYRPSGAADVSGPPEKMAAYAREVARRFGL